MKIPSITQVAIGALALGLSSVISSGQELSNVSDASVVSGQYKPLTVWDSINLGASYFTNPERAKTANVAYSFDGPEFSGQAKGQALWDIAQQGKIAFGVTDKDKKHILVMPLSELQKRYAVKSPTDLLGVLTKDDVMVVFSDKNLLGEISKTVVVKSAPEKQPDK